MPVLFGSASMAQVLGQPNVVYDRVSGTEFRASQGKAIAGGRLAQQNDMGRLILNPSGQPQLKTLPNNTKPVYFSLLGTDVRKNQPINLIIPFDGLGG